MLAYFFVEGGEYGTSDLFNVRGRIGETKTAIDSLKLVVDSLSRDKKNVMTNPAVQERIAREDFGMVKGDRELVFHLLRNDSSVVSSDSGARGPTP
jgi:cell division protein FtsB